MMNSSVINRIVGKQISRNGSARPAAAITALAAALVCLLLPFTARADEGVISVLDLGHHLVASGSPNFKSASHGHYDFTGNYTIEFWLRPDMLDGVYRPVLSTSGNSNNGFVVSIQHSALQIEYRNTGIFVSSGNGFFNNAREWVHCAVAVSFDGANTHFTFFKNGNQFVDIIRAGQVFPIASGAGIAILGVPGAHFGGRYQGAIDEVRIWNVARPANDISSYFDKHVTSTSTNLIGYWRFDELVDLQTGAAGQNDFQDLSDRRSHLDVSGATYSLQTQGTVYHSDGPSGERGYSISGVGDVNGDGLEDFIIGSNFGGEVALVYGKMDEPAPAPLAATAADNCADAEPISLFQVYTGSTAGANSDGLTNCGTSDSSPDVWYKFIPDFTGDVIAATHGSLYDTVLSVHSGCPATVGNTINCNDDQNAGYLQSQVEFYVERGEEYYIRVSGFNGQSGSFRLLLSSPYAANRVDMNRISPDQGAYIVGSSDDSFSRKVYGVGDVNGDGFSDFLIGAAGYDRPGAANSGAAFLIFGNANGVGTNGVLNVSGLNGQNGVVFLGAAAGNNAGTKVGGAGDVNGDGLDDFLIAAPQYSPPSGNAAGSVYVIFGSRTGFGVGGTMDLAEIGSLEDQGLSGTRVDGIAANALLGDWVAGAGDVNGDGYDDFLVSDQDLNAGQGVVYVVYGSARNEETGVGIGRNGVLELTNREKDWNQDGVTDGLYASLIQGVAGISALGNHLSGAGDVNGDGFNDIIIGAFNSDSSQGKAFIVYGRSTALGDSTGLANLGSYLDGARGIELRALGLGIDLFHGFAARGVGDVNGDGFADMMVGSYPSTPSGRSNAGAGYVLMGQATPYANAAFVNLETLGRDQVLLWAGGAPFDFVGYDVTSLGDINGDHVQDYAISAPFNRTRVFVFNGSASPSASSLYRHRMRHGVGQVLGQLQTYLNVPPKGVGMIGNATHSVPMSLAEIGFTGGQTGNKSPSTQDVRLRRQVAPQSYIFDEGGANETPFTPIPLVWQFTTNRVEFEQSTMVLYYSPSDVAGLTQDQIDNLGVFRSTVDPFGGSAAASDWIPVVETVHDQPNRRFVITRAHDPAIGIPSPSQVEFNGYYSIFAGETQYDLGTIISPTANVDVNKLPSIGPLVSPSDAAHWHAGQKKLFATKAYATVVIQWIDDTDPNKPAMDITVASFVWPGSATDFFDNTNIGTYQNHIANTPPINVKAEDEDGVVIANVQVRDTEAIIDVNQVQATGEFSAMGEGRTLLMLSDGDPAQDGLWFQFLWTLPFNNPYTTTTGVEVAVGTDLGIWGEDNDALHTLEAGEPYLMSEFGFYNAGEGYYNRAAAPATGPLIPVNIDMTGPNSGGDDFDVVYYERGGKLQNGLDSGDSPTFFLYWPWYPVRFDVQWPDITDPLKTIVIASQRGANLPSAEVIDPFIYYNNDRYLPGPDEELGTADDVPTLGYNPNEEHAVLILLNEGWAAYALRNDLDRPDTSEPYVLVQHLNPSRGNRPAMSLFSVELEDEDDTFYYANPPAIVPAPIEPFFPLNSTLFPLCVPSTQGGIDGNHTTTPDKVWGDRTGRLWSISAGLQDDEASSASMRFFYRLRDGFYMPQEYVDALRTRDDLYPVEPGNDPFEFGTGTCIPCLDDWWDDVNMQANAASVGVPLEVHYKLEWPLDAPTLQVAETLVEAKKGLPGIDGNESVDLLFQQTTAQNPNTMSVKLIDPTQERWVDLEELPGGMATVRVMGRLEFEDLAPHLRRRLIFDDNAERLIWRGQFIGFVAGEDMLLPNVMTVRERDAIKDISDETDWKDIVDDLYAETQGVVEITSNTTPFDSLALTSALATGTGFVTLGFNNKPDAQSMPFAEVIRVDCPLYTGDLKIIYPDCPFDDKVALRHSGDFTGVAEDYEFEWKYMDAATYLQISQETGFPPDNDHPLWTEFPFDNASDKIGAVDILVQGGSGELVLSDLFWIMRYKPVAGASHLCGADYSPWTGVGLTEGWVKRVVGDFGPFNQRATGGGIQGAEDNFVDYRNRTVNTVVSMIAQAGERWEGNVPLTCNNVDGLGLIEVYQTVLNRAIQLSLDAAPRINLDGNGDGIPDTSATAGVSNALLLAASRIADLYTLLGNEAYADASDPTIVFGTDDGTWGAFATSIHPFMNQTATLLEEEKALLHGRDDTKMPDYKIRPFYNRLIWNFTNDFVGGEVAYVLNYGISDANGDSRIDEADAAQLYPQAHGDAWGHMLSAIKAYYYLIRRPEFAWVPRTEPVLVAGIPVEVDYFDERKFAEVAAAMARTGKEVVNLTYRASYVENPDGQWQGYKDTRPGRHWGLSEWGSRTGQGAYYNWIVANGLLPPDDGQGKPIDIRKIDRSTVGELQEIAANFEQIQQTIDQADGGLNPLGLAKNVVPFDINPAALAFGKDPKTHFEQVFDRAIQALNNAQTVFDYATAASVALRKQADTISDFQVAVEDQEIDFLNRLIQIFGTPYPDDIGPGKTYPSGYFGPDLVHWMYYDPAQVEFTDIPQDVREIEVTFRKDLNFADIVDNLNFDFTDDVLTDSGIAEPPTSIGNTVTVKYHVSKKLGAVKPASWTAPRQVYGELQIAQLEWLRNVIEFRKRADDYSGLIAQMDDKVQLLEAQWNVKASQVQIRNTAQNTSIGLDTAIFVAKVAEIAFNQTKEISEAGTEIAVTGGVTSVGFSNDIGAAIRVVAKTVGAVTSKVLNALEIASQLTGQALEITKGQVEKQADLAVTLASDVFEIQQAIAEIRDLLLNDSTLRFALLDQENKIMQSAAKYSAIAAQGEQLLEDRARFRRKTAARVQDYRYKDMAFRIFRNEAVQKYRAQFDLASRYAYLAANSYDFETNLLGGDTNGPGEEFLTQIVRSRALGRIANGEPQTGFSQGDPGLADVMARMKLNWDLVLKGQLGFENPQTETNRFSLRRELFRIGLNNDASPGGLSAEDSAAKWREVLSRPYGGVNNSGIVDDIFALPEFRQYAIPFTAPSSLPEPAIVIRFGTNVNFAQNFFVNFDENQAWPLGAGDSAYDTTNFATKIRSVGMWFVNYNTLAGSGMSNTPRIYLFPTGSDYLRSPTGNRGEVRAFSILDQAIPAPFPIGGAALSDPMWTPAQDTLGESFITIRRFPSFRAYHSDQSYLNNPDELNTTQLSLDSRLVGRSVWNDEWLIIIPGGTLHSNRDEGIRRFIYGKLGTAQDGSFVIDDQGQQRDGNGVNDILLFFQTYAYSGI